MATLFQRHCSDEALIAHLDGELPFYRRASVRRHIEKCWNCRLRLSEIDSQVLEATRAIKRDPFPGPQRIAEARLAFLARADAIAEEVLGERRRSARVVSPRGFAWAGACLALLGAFATWRLTRQDPPIAAAEAIEQIENAEAAVARAPAHQRFRVVARQLRPAPASRESRLETWSEPARGRFAAQYSDSRGALRHAVWQPAPGRQYVYRAARAATVVKLSRQQAREHLDAILFREGLTLEELEAGLLTWLENRPWRPVSFSSGVSRLASAGGAAVAASQIRTADGRSLLRLRARQSRGPVTVEFTLDVDPRTYAPQLQSIRYESPARSLELELYSEQAEWAPAAVSFEPPAELAREAAPAIEPPPAVRPEPAAPPEPDPRLLETEIHYALHSVGACLGETIEVDRAPGGAFEVRGVVATNERKEQVLAALSSVSGPRVAVDVKSAREALSEIDATSLTSDAPPQPPAVSPGRAKAMQRLSRLFSGNLTEAEDFADKALSAGEDLMRDAQALRLLAERFGTRGAAESRETSRMLEAMSADHLKQLAAKAEAMRALLRPVIGDAPRRLRSAPRERWDAESLRAFNLANGLNERLRLLFTGEEADLAAGTIAEALAQLESALAPR